MTLKQQARALDRLGGQLQAPRCRWIELTDLADHSGQFWAAQPLLQSPKAFRISARTHQQQPFGRDIETGQRRGIEVGPPGCPENLSFPSGRQPAEQGQSEAKRGAVVPLAAGRQDLM